MRVDRAAGTISSTAFCQDVRMPPEYPLAERAVLMGAVATPASPAALRYVWRNRNCVPFSPLWPALVAAMLPSTRPMGEVLVDRGLDQARWRLPGFSESR